MSKRIRVLHISSSDLGGGAARAAFRLHGNLNHGGLDSWFLVQQKFSDAASVLTYDRILHRSMYRIRRFLDLIPGRLTRTDLRTPWHVGWLPRSFQTWIRRLSPDIVNLHWVADGFVSFRALRSFGRPIVWTLHDMAPFTGGCHYSGGCRKFEASCGKCPLLNSSREGDLSRFVWRYKRGSFHGLDLSVVAPSRWMLECAEKSSLFSIFPCLLIPYGVDLKQFRPIDRHSAKRAFGLARDTKVVLFGAAACLLDQRKGFHHFANAVGQIASVLREVRAEVVIFGSSERASGMDLVGITVRFYGLIKEQEKLAIAYSGGDVFVAPSREDNLPNMVLESMACGTPCVAFEIGGIPDMIEHEVSGYLEAVP